MNTTGIQWNAVALRHVVESLDAGGKATNFELRKRKISARVAMASNMIQRAQNEF